MKVCLFPFINIGREGLQPASGYSTYFLELFRALRSEGIDAHLIAAGSATPTRDRETFIHNAVMPAIFLSNTITLHSLLPQRYLTSYVRNLDTIHQFDVFHTMSPWNFFLGYGKPCVATTFGVIPSAGDVMRTYWKLYRGFKKPATLLNVMVNAFEKAALSKCDAIIVTYRSKMGSLARLLSSDRVVHIPLGISCMNKRNVTPRKPRARLLYVCNDLTRRRNGIYKLLEALALARRAGTSLHLTLVGDNGSGLRPTIDKLGIRDLVFDAGLLPRKDLDNLYSQVDAFVFPGLIDDCPYAVLEAMSHGLPIICSDLPTFRERVSERNGLLVPPGRADILTSVLIALFQDESRLVSLGEESRTMASTQFSWKQIVSETSKVYEKVIQREPVSVLDNL